MVVLAHWASLQQAVVVTHVMGHTWAMYRVRHKRVLALRTYMQLQGC